MATKKVKKRVLSKADKYYIEQNRHLTNEQLAIDIGCTDRAIQKVVAEMPAAPEEAQPASPATREIKERTMTHDSFARNEKRGVVMLTPGAAQQSDESAKVARQKARKAYLDCTQPIR